MRLKWWSFGSSCFRLTFKFKPKLGFVDIELEEPATYMTAWAKLELQIWCTRIWAHTCAIVLCLRLSSFGSFFHS